MALKSPKNFVLFLEMALNLEAFMQAGFSIVVGLLGAFVRIGGGAFHRASPFGRAFEDVRALGFLRPPWSLAFDSIVERTWERLNAP